MDNLERLFREYHGPLVRYLTRRVGDPDLAEELAQETFVRASRQASFTHERAWLFAVATNLVRDEARRDSRERRRLALVAHDLSQEAHARTVDADDADDADDTVTGSPALAQRAVHALAERDRAALLMRDEGLTYPEIAAALGLSVGSVGTTLSRARRRLVEIYEQLQHGGAHSGASEPLSLEGSDVA